MKNNLMTRIITGALLMAIIIPAVYFGGVFFLIISIILSVVGSYELMNMFNKKSPTLRWLRYVLPIFNGFFIICLYFAINKELSPTFIIQSGQIIASFRGTGAGTFTILSIVTLGLSIFFSFFSCILIDGTTSQDMFACVTTIIYTGLFMGLALSVEYIKITTNPEALEVKSFGAFFAYLYTIVVFTDVFAYLVGSKFGKKRLCPNISPKKSVEGAIGGLVMGGLFGTLSSYLFGIMPLSITDKGGIKVLIIIGIFILSCILSVAVQFGDLVASKLKRSYEIKDYGFIFPGHGGVMDRFDSLIFSGAFFFIIIILSMATIGV